MLKSLSTVLAASAFALVALPANAATISEQIDLCAGAIDAEGLAQIEDYKVKFVSASGGSMKRVMVKLLPRGAGETVVVECKIKRGEVKSVSLDA